MIVAQSKRYAHQLKGTGFSPYINVAKISGL
jgi:hypothetical protein